MEDRSPRFRIGQLASRTGVAPERLRKWEARYALLDPQRSGGGFRLYSPDDEQRVRLMQRHLARGYAAAEAAELAREGVVAPSPARLVDALPRAVVARSFALFRTALSDYDEGAAQRALDDLFRAFKVEAVLRDAILPFLREVGEAWAGGAVVPGQEHFASTIIEARLLSLTTGWGTGSGPRALLACPAGERHTLGLVAFGIALSRRGWRIAYLGQDTPGESLRHAARTLSPALIVLSSVQPRWYTAASADLSTLAAQHRMALAGAGATRRMAAKIGAEWLEADPVTAALELKPTERNRPA